MANTTNEELKNLILPKFRDLVKKITLIFSEGFGKIKNVDNTFKMIEANLDRFISYQELASSILLDGITLTCAAIAQFFNRIVFA